jgi:hypothetical protein
LGVFSYWLLEVNNEMGMTEYVLLLVMFAIIMIVVVLPVYIFTRPMLKELKELKEQTEQIKNMGKKK